MTLTNPDDYISDLSNFLNEIERILREKYNFNKLMSVQDRNQDIKTIVADVGDTVSSLYPDGLPEKSIRIIIKGVLAKQAFEQVLENENICEECIDDLSSEFARQLLNDDEKREWNKFWNMKTPPRKVSSVIVYNPVKSFNHLENLTGDKGFRTIVREICTASKSGVHLNLEDYSTYLRARFQRFSSKIDLTELKIIRHLVCEGDADNDALSEIAGVSPQWVSRKLTHLKKRAILRKLGKVPFSRIGIRIFNLLISTIGTDDDPFRLLAKCPFLYSYRKVLSGFWNAVAVLCVPDNQKSIRSLRQIVTALGKWNYESSLREIASSGISNCFDSYNVEIGEWNIPWELLEIELKRIILERLADLMPRVDMPYNRTNIHLDDIDIRILEQIIKRNFSITGIREVLKVGQQKVSDKIKRMKDEGIIVSLWEAHNLGLNEGAIVACDDISVGKAIGAWALRLPKAIISFDINKTMMLLTNLSRGGAFGLTYSLSSLSGSTSVGILGANEYGSWGFPVDLWNAKQQKWMYPKKQVEEWIESLL